eukprot:TRINITY_DN14532_c0_g1_i1.p1 TRINITY_DN14532_c0_g1~~TRINITY_DN14532_c0_g1_i1.p1  ORF type:complete len:339 (-),score=53.22 TRINITY_DN14532_c0_g1_i1:411-1427(-)
MRSLICLVLAVSATHSVLGHRKHHDEKYECSYTDSFGSHYDLSKLSDPPEAGYSFHAESETIYFNVCGDLRALAASPCAGSDAGVCVVSNDSASNDGKASSMAFSDYAGGYGLVLTYTGGDACNASGIVGQRRSVLNFVCPDGYSNVGLGITSYDEVDECTTVLNLTSVYACPNSQLSGGSWWMPILFWSWIAACGCLCCLCCCVCARRCRARRQVKQQMDKILAPALAPSPAVAYTSVPVSEVDVAQPLLDEVPPPYPGFQHYSTNSVVYPPAYEPVVYMQTYSYPPAYPYQSPDAPAVQPSAPASVRAPATVDLDVVTVNDEALARALQSEYDSRV